jgi:hypothetical protein
MSGTGFTGCWTRWWSAQPLATAPFLLQNSASEMQCSWITGANTAGE